MGRLTTPDPVAAACAGVGRVAKLAAFWQRILASADRGAVEGCTWAVDDVSDPTWIGGIDGKPLWLVRSNHDMEFATCRYATARRAPLPSGMIFLKKIKWP